MNYLTFNSKSEIKQYFGLYYVNILYSIQKIIHLKIESTFDKKTPKFIEIKQKALG